MKQSDTKASHLRKLWTITMTMGLAVAASGAQAELLGDTLDFPLLTYDNQGSVRYTSMTDLFKVDATPLAIRVDAMNPPTDITGQASLTLRAEVDQDGFLTGGIAGDDFVLTGDVDLGALGTYSGTLLTGEVTAFGFEDSGGTTDFFDFRVLVTGGELEFLYPGTAAVQLTSEQSDFTGDFTEELFTGEAKGTIGTLTGLECTLALDKKCLVIRPPAPGGWECTKPIDTLTMIWDGPQTDVGVVAYKGDTGAAVVGERAGIDPGDEVSFTGFAGSPNDVVWEIFDEFGNLVGESTFHLSCSDSEMNGPEDCGNREGNGKSNDSGLINDWLLEGIVDAGGVLNCTPDAAPEPADSCTFVSRGGTECTKRPTTIAFRYNGGDCGQSSNAQDDGKWSCEDFGDAGEPARVVVFNDDAIYADDSGVRIGDTVQATAAMAGRDDFDSEVAAHIVDATGALVQEISLHSSCSQTLRLGDRFGSLEVVGFENEEQGFVQSGRGVVYFYEVTNTGGETINDVQVSDSSLDPNAVPGSPIAAIEPGATRTLVTSVFLSDTAASTASATASTASGAVCEDTDDLTVVSLGPPPCQIASEEFELNDDKVEWTLSNTGDQTATIESIELAWPAGLGDLEKVKFDGDIFKDDRRAPPSTMLDADDFTGGIDRRELEAGDSRKLVFEFEHDFDDARPDDFTITVNFAEGCSITFVPGVGDWDCDKPIDELRMIWVGAGAVDVEAWKGDVGSESLGVVTGVTRGDLVTIDGFAGSPNNVRWEIFSAVNGTKLGESEFHLSCSDPEMNGPEDCRTRQGNGKDNDPDLINGWALFGILDDGGELDCSVTPPG